MEFKRLMFSGLLGAAFVLGGSELQAQEKKVIKVGEHKPTKVKLKTQEPAKHEHQTKLFEKAAKLSAKASDLAAAGKHQEAAAMARKAAELLSSGYQTNVTKPIGTTDFWVNKEGIPAQEQHNKAIQEAKRAQREAKIAFVEAMDGREALSQKQLLESHELLELREHLGQLHEGLAELHLEGENNIVLKLEDLAQLNELQNLQGVQELLTLQELDNVQVLGKLGYVQEGDCGESECDDVQVFRYRSAPDGAWHSESGNAPEAMIWHGESGDLSGSFKIEMRLEGEAPMVLQGNPLAPQPGSAPQMRYRWVQPNANLKTGKGPSLFPAPGGIKQGRYQLRTAVPEGFTGLRQYRVPMPTGEEAEYHVKLHVIDGAECEIECTSECEVECVTECEVDYTTECEVECDASFPQPETRQEVKVRVAPRAKGIGLPGMRVAPAKPAKPSNSEAQVLINEMQRELDALRKEIQDLRRTIGNDPLVMRYRSAIQDEQVAKAVPVSTEL